MGFVHHVRFIVVMCLLGAFVVTGNTVMTSEELLLPKDSLIVDDIDLSNNNKATSTLVSANSERFTSSAARITMYEKAELGKQYYSEGFGGRLNSMLKRVLDNHPNRDELLAKHGRQSPHIEHHMIPMRDGKKLSTLVIFPPMVEGERRSAMMSRSPYAPTSDQVANLFTVMNGFVSIVQDQRGTFLSEGEFSMWTHDAEDGEDTLFWAIKQPWSNGKVFGVGISADGCSLASLLRLNPHPPLAGALLMWASANGHESTYQGGSFRAGLITGWMVLQAPLTKGVSLKKTLPELLANWKLSPGGYWEQIQGPGKWHMVNWPTVHITAWFDIFSGHQINMYNGFRSSSPLEHRLIVGAIGHCILGLPPKDDPLLDLVDADAIEMGYGYASELFGGFEERGHIFKDKLDLINIYVQGSRKHGRRGDAKVGHYWSSFANWPVVDYQKIFLGPQGSMDIAEKSKKKLRTNSEYAEYKYDPRSPMLTRGGNNLVIHLLGFGCGSEDQRESEKRTDQMVIFDTNEVLGEALALTGHITAVLYVSTTARDTDFHVSLNDLHPTGESMQIRYGLRRLRLRDSNELQTVVSEVEPNKVYKLEVDLWFTSYIIAPGHKIRVTVTSSNTPYFAVNPNTADEQDQYGLGPSQVAINRVYFTEEYPSHIILPVVNAGDLKRNHRIKARYA